MAGAPKLDFHLVKKVAKKEADGDAPAKKAPAVPEGAAREEGAARKKLSPPKKEASQ